MILNSDQSRQYNRAYELQNFLINNKEVCERYQPFNIQVQLFYKNVDELKLYIPVKGKTGVPVTSAKSDLKTGLAEDVNNICTAAGAYAITIADKDLAYAVRYRTSDITNAKDGDVLALVIAVSDAVSPLIGDAAFDMYEITAGTLADIVKDANTFNNSIGKAAVVDGNRSIANKNIDEVFAAIRDNITMFDLLINQMKKNNPNFAEGYHKAIALNYSGIRHNGVEGMITNTVSGLPIKDVTITGEGKNKTALTNSEGFFKLIKIKAGKRTFTITAPGYESQTIETTIVRSKIVSLSIALSAQVISMETA